MKELLTSVQKLSTSNLTVKRSSDGVAEIFMVELENTLVSRLKNYLLLWKRYVDNTLLLGKGLEITSFLP